MCLFSISLVIPPCGSHAVTFLFIVVYRFWSCDLLRREIILSEKARSCFPWFLELTARVDSHVIIVSDYFPVWSFYVISIFKAPNTYNSSKTTSHQNCFKNLIFAPHGRVNNECCFWCMPWTKLTYSQICFIHSTWFQWRPTWNVCNPARDNQRNVTKYYCCYFFV